MKRIRLVLIQIFVLLSGYAYTQKNISYPADTSTTVYIEGYLRDTVLNYQKLYAQTLIQLKTNNPDYTIVQYELWWTCPEAGFREYRGDTISHSALKGFSGSNFMLMIRSVLVQNKKGYYFRINDRYYTFKD